MMFNYKLLHLSGVVVAESVKAALNNAKKDYIRRVYSLGPTSPGFRIQMFNLQGHTASLTLGDYDTVVNRQAALYKLVGDGEASQRDIQEYEATQAIIEDLKKLRRK